MSKLNNQRTIVKQNNLKSLKSNPLQGVVIAYFGNSVSVETADAQIVQCLLLRNQPLPVVGDQVLFQLNDTSGTILEILPRRSLLSRGDGKGKIKPIAANIDLLFIVMAPPPVFSEYLIDRYLVAAELLNIPAVIVLNKIDLLDQNTYDQAIKRLDIYAKISYPVILSSIFLKDGLQGISDFLSNKTAVLLGPSGVGKSSIIAFLGKQEDIPVGEVSAKGAGKHTTTGTRLYHLPHGGHLIDSPGVREFNLWMIKKEDLLKGFREFQQFLHQCKFRDCLHIAEPKCTIKAAVAEDKIAQERYTSYQELLKNFTQKK